MAEFDWIERYLKPIARSAGAMGLENDVALLSDISNRPAIATMDTLVEGVHFLRDDPLDTVARKLVRVNVSDILCKGARPREALLSFAAPHDFEEERFAAFCRGLGDDLAHWETALIGGDLVRTPGPLVITLAVTGICEGDGPVTRSGAQAGDLVLVTGRIGAGRLGLRDAEAGQPGPLADLYRVPAIPSLSLASVIAAYATASIDISDGLLSDAGHIARASAGGLHIALDQVPWAAPVSNAQEMLSLATGGDDYQTLFTIRPDDLPTCAEAMGQASVEFRRIGQVEKGEGLRLSLHGQAVSVPPVTGYQH